MKPVYCFPLIVFFKSNLIRHIEKIKNDMFLSEVGDGEEEASVAILGSDFSLGSGAATANANAEQAKSRGRNDGVVARPRAVG